MGKGEHDLSEMFTVRNNYNTRINDNFIRRGRGNIGPGSIAHMAINSIAQNGFLPQSVYNGINYDSPTHNHGELSMYMRAIVDASVKSKKRSPEYYELLESLFDTYLGEVPETFTYEDKEYTALSFRDELEFDCSQYVEITSFSHHPFYEKIQVEIPDNWDHQRMYNLPLDEFMSVIDYALENGYTIAWDGDCSEAGYDFANQIAILPKDKSLKRDDVTKTKTVIEEVDQVCQKYRQEGFENFTTTDDHLELIFGIAKDQNGVKYYNTKNSWGTDRNGTGLHYMSEKFVRAKTIGILVHKNSIPKDIRKKLGIK